MLKLILVDDEEDVREGLIRQIDWEGNGFLVTDRAENGREAMEMIEKSRPDVVVTDIHMPFMDGLQLAEWVRETYPLTKIIILTGYDEFEYARRAIRLQIDEYVLKPFSAGELVDILRKVKEQIELETVEKENIQLLREHYQRSLPVLRELFLAELVSGRISKKDIREKRDTLGMDLTEGPYLASVISLDAPVQVDPPGHQQASILGTGRESRSLQLFAVRNIAEELCADTPDHLVFMAGEDIALIACRLRDTDEVPRRTLRLLELIRDKVVRFLHRSITIGVGSVMEEVSRLHQSYRDARQALDYRLVMGGGKVIWIHDVETSGARRERLSLDGFMEQQLIRGIKVGTGEERSRVVEELFDQHKSVTASIQDYQIYWLELMAVVLRLAKESGTDPQELFGPGSNPLSEFSSFTGPEHLKERLKDICAQLACKFESGRTSSTRSSVEDAKAYVQRHYADNELSIGEVCRQLHISTGYFSTIFKKETGMTFVTYLMFVRLEAAKKLLRTTELKAFEIAEKTGFSDPNYFSFCFRKKFGLSPKEYRLSGEG
ncbi:response regulator [Paenibacillus sp. DMB20]|uniref:response regulator n=1 Tax=Paenibacillus sp. DMB20 TaxID=1642570 RepID=UPI0006280BF1|nr:response regulator [Paenibacillus sp. DMB20]KKO53885.1 hypothetical protein XI25_10620 [Paenibacillus sp. DMB20]